jgi:anti-sigma B factor antagonist
MTNSHNAPGCGPFTLRIDGEMSIYRAAELKTVLLDALERSVELDIDLSAVSEIDTAGVQLLMLAGKAAQEKQQSLRLIAPSPAVVDVFEMLDVAVRIGNPPDSSTHDRA